MKKHYLKKKEFYSNWKKQDITDADYMHVKRVCKDFKINNSVEFILKFILNHDFILKLKNDFEWIEDTLQFNEDLIKKYSEENDKV